MLFFIIDFVMIEGQCAKNVSMSACFKYVAYMHSVVFYSLLCNASSSFTSLPMGYIFVIFRDDHAKNHAKNAGVNKFNHKVHKYLEYHSFCPLFLFGTPPSPLPQASVPPLNPKGGTHSPACEGVGESQLRRLEKRLSTLSTL
jgi:hypothetical protein